MIRLAVVLGLLSACASGVSGTSDVGPRGDTDVGAPDTGGGADSSMPDTNVVDTAPPCIEDTHPSTCAEATDLGMINVGDAPTTLMGNLPTLRDEDWFHVQFPPESMPNMPGGGMPSIMVEGDSTTIIDIRTSCTAGPVICGEGSNVDMTSYSFVDDQSMPGPMQWSTRDIAWPAEVWVKVGRNGGPANCDDYSLTVMR